MNEIILSVRNLKKSFDGVPVLEDINLDFIKGEVHAILGENGAGKSTLIKIISGYHPLDSGKIIFNGREVNFKSPKDALMANIHTIYQELNVCSDMTVAENIIINNVATYGKIFQRRDKYTKDVLEIFKKLNQYDMDLKTPAGNLSVAKRQIIEIAKAVLGNAKIIIMDEPTSSISQSDAEVLKKLILSLKQEGITVLYITHRLQEIYEIADRLTVLRDGHFIGTLNRDEFNDDKIITMMVGRKLKNLYPKKQVKIGEKILEVKNLTSHDGKFHDISFSLKKGEILGIGGLVGSGRSELFEAIFGLRKIAGGEIYYNNSKISIESPRCAINQGISFITEDRNRTGLIPYFSVRENINLINSQFVNTLGVLKLKTLNEIAIKYQKRLNIRLHSLSQMITSLSGGNQQKVAVAKWLEIEPKIILFDEPTRGIDIGAKTEIYKIMGELVSRGIAIIMISSELPELLSVTDRILVMRQGSIVAELISENTSQEEIMRYATKFN